jgi:hypothetical protein
MLMYMPQAQSNGDLERLLMAQSLMGRAFDRFDRNRNPAGQPNVAGGPMQDPAGQQPGALGAQQPAPQQAQPGGGFGFGSPFDIPLQMLRMRQAFGR